MARNCFLFLFFLLFENKIKKKPFNLNNVIMFFIWDEPSSMNFQELGLRCKRSCSLFLSYVNSTISDRADYN